MIKKTLAERSLPRQPVKGELSFINRMSSELASLSGLSKEWIQKVLLQTLPDQPIAGSDGAEPHPTALYLFKPCLFEAMRALSKDEVVEYFSSDLRELKKLEIAFDNMLDEIPFQKFEDFTHVMPAFEKYLKDEAASIIDFGQPSQPFKQSYWLQEIFTESRLPRIESRVLQASELRKLIGANWAHDRLESGNENSDQLLNQDALQSLLGNDWVKRQWHIREWFQETRGMMSIDDLRDRLSNRKNKVAVETRNFLSLPTKGITFPVPSDFLQRERAYRAALHQFSQKSLKTLIYAVDTDRPTNLMQECWGHLMSDLKSDHLELLLNRNFKALGIEEKIPEGVTYNYGSGLVTNILSAAGLVEELGKDDFLYSIHENLDPLIDRYRLDKKTVMPVDGSLFEAIYLCGESDVKAACTKYSSVAEKIREIERSVKKTMSRVLDLTVEQIRETRKRLVELDYFRLATGFDAGVMVSKSMTKPVPELTGGAFSSGYSEYRSKNSKFEIFKFSKEQRKAIAVLYRAYSSGYPEVKVSDLVQALYTQEKIQSLPRTDDGRYKWRLTHDFFNSKHDAVKFGFIQPGELRQDERTYKLSFEFEELDPEAILKKKKLKRDQYVESLNRTKSSNTDKPSKLKSAKKPSNEHLWRKKSVGKKGSPK